MSEKTISFQEAKRILGCTTDELWALVNSKALKEYPGPGRAPEFSEGQVSALAAKRAQALTNATPVRSSIETVHDGVRTRIELG